MNSYNQSPTKKEDLFENAEVIRGVPEKKLGAGNFGEVHQIGEFAIKTWKNDQIDIQEVEINVNLLKKNKKKSNKYFSVSKPVYFYNTNTQIAKPALANKIAANGDLILFLKNLNERSPSLNPDVLFAYEHNPAKFLNTLFKRIRKILFVLFEYNGAQLDFAARNFLIYKFKKKHFSSNKKYITKFPIKLSDFGTFKFIPEKGLLLPEDHIFPIRWAKKETLFLREANLTSDLFSFKATILTIFYLATTLLIEDTSETVALKHIPNKDEYLETKSLISNEQMLKAYFEHTIHLLDDNLKSSYEIYDTAKRMLKSQRILALLKLLSAYEKYITYFSDTLTPAKVHKEDYAIFNSTYKNIRDTAINIVEYNNFDQSESSPTTRPVDSSVKSYTQDYQSDSNEKKDHYAFHVSPKSIKKGNEYNFHLSPKDIVRHKSLSSIKQGEYQFHQSPLNHRKPKPPIVDASPQEPVYLFYQSPVNNRKNPPLVRSITTNSIYGQEINVSSLSPVLERKSPPIIIHEINLDENEDKEAIKAAEDNTSLTQGGHSLWNKKLNHETFQWNKKKTLITKPPTNT